MVPANYICSIPIDTLLEQLNEHPECFGVHSYRKNLFAHNSMTDIWVRYNDIDNLGVAFNDEHDSVWYPEAYIIPEAIKLCFMLMATVNGERLGGVLITKIPPGGEVLRHTDDSWHSHYYDKYLVPVQNEDGAVFYWDNFNICPKAGDVYEFINTVPHWVKNDSDKDRIVMIVCIKKFRGVR